MYTSFLPGGNAYLVPAVDLRGSTAAKGKSAAVVVLLIGLRDPQRTSPCGASRNAKGGSNLPDHPPETVEDRRHMNVSVRRVVFSMATGYPNQDLFRIALGNLRLPPQRLSGVFALGYVVPPLGGSTMLAPVVLNGRP